MQPLFEFSGACAGCGETPYLKLLTQLFGDRALIANATGCSSIYGGNLPTTPYARNAEGRGPTWCNSLFEDNAEFGLGYRVSIDKQKELAGELLHKLAATLGDDLVAGILNASQDGRSRDRRPARARRRPESRSWRSSIPPRPACCSAWPINWFSKSVWIVGGDGWAYDIGYGGLDHVLASGRDVNVLVLDTEVYSNTGGQMSKSTPRGAVAKFAAGGKPGGKKDLGPHRDGLRPGLRRQRGHGRQGRADPQGLRRGGVLSRAFPDHRLQPLHRARHRAWTLAIGARQQKLAVDSGQWLLYRYDPAPRRTRREPAATGFPAAARRPCGITCMSENRFKMLTMSKPDAAKQFFAQAQTDAERRRKFYQFMQSRNFEAETAPAAPPKMTATVTQHPPNTIRANPITLWTCPQPTWA